MKLLHRRGDEFEFEFALEEKTLLFHLLGMYPVVPAAYHRLTKGKKQTPKQKESQELLDDAMRSECKANQREILRMVSKPGRFTDEVKTSRAVFKREELEWLLQVLNDVRVGSWLRLGSPGTPRERELPHDKNFLRQLMLMEIAGGFEMFILGAISGTLRPEIDEP